MAQNQVFKGTARSIAQTERGTEFFYHRTAIVVLHRDGSIRLDSGGWRTATTKRAMNQASNQFGLGFNVYQKAGKWFVDTDTGQTLAFFDGMHIKGE